MIEYKTQRLHCLEGTHGLALKLIKRFIDIYNTGSRIKLQIIDQNYLYLTCENEIPDKFLYSIRLFITDLDNFLYMKGL